ncbi:hypothetical protein [Sedimenticola selenatireducens]|uniref:hypothetical protein n=1 Tax=Sedimenticola selenatireducens TaxID=191960 RepID=UPI002357A3CD|nr:hypothetical protein [Sedimenticola selenatireducens]
MRYTPWPIEASITAQPGKSFNSLLIFADLGVISGKIWTNWFYSVRICLQFDFIHQQLQMCSSSAHHLSGKQAWRPFWY